MGRKNNFSPASETDAPVASENALAETRPMNNIEKPLRSSGARGAISQSMGGLTQWCATRCIDGGEAFEEVRRRQARHGRHRQFFHRRPFWRST